mgnify:CR=1 FL=1
MTVLGLVTLLFAHSRLWQLDFIIPCSNGTSVITLVVPPGQGRLARASKMLAEELGTASHIKDPTNRSSVMDAIRSAQHRLRQTQQV